MSHISTSHEDNNNKKREDLHIFRFALKKMGLVLEIYSIFEKDFFVTGKRGNETLWEMLFN